MSTQSMPAKAFSGASQKYTNIPILPSLIVAVIGGSLTLGLAKLLQASVPYIYGLIHDRGGVQYLTIYFFWLALGMLVFKWRMIKREKSAFQLPYIKEFTVGKEMMGKTMLFAEHAMIEENVDAEHAHLLLVSRVNKGIKQLKISNSPAEMANVLSTVASTDSAIIDASYVPVKFMIWVIPVLGFVGTVVGMSNSIGSFNTVLQGISNLGFQGMQQALGSVTAGLAVAFDTTFLALVMAAFVNFLTNALQKQEEDFLSDVEDFTTDNIVNKLSLLQSQLSPLPGSPSEEIWPKMLERIEGLSRDLKNITKQNQVNAEALQAQVGRVVESLDKGSQDGDKAVLSDEFCKALEEFSQALKANGESFKSMANIGRLLESNHDVLESLKDPIGEMTSVNRKLGELYGKIYKTTF